MLLKNKLDNLKKIVKKQNLLTELEERYCYAQDSTNIRTIQGLPDAVVFVETIEDVQEVLRFANKNKIPVISRGAGTNMVGACTCPKGGIVLNFSKMNKILDFNPQNMTMRVQPGVVIDEIKKLAESQNLFYPPDPSNFKVSTIGGSIAQASGGAKAFKYGTTKDYILSLTVVLADGSITKLGAGTVKDAVGYHLNQLIVGSEGTLAIVVEAELKLIPKPEVSGLITVYLNSINDIETVVDAIFNTQIFPATIDFMDKNSIITVEKFYSCGLNVEKEALLLIELDGSKEAVVIQKDKLITALNKKNIFEINYASTEDDIEKIWTARRLSYAATTKLAPDVVSDDIIVPRNKLSEIINFCHKTCEKYHLQVCAVGHVGDGNIHPQIALNLENDIEFKNYVKAKTEIYEKVLDLKGTISAEHGIGQEKLSYFQNYVDLKALEIMKSIKKIFDPNNILNPDKIFKI